MSTQEQTVFSVTSPLCSLCPLPLQIVGYLPKGHDLGLQVSQEVPNMSAKVGVMAQKLQGSQLEGPGFKSTNKPGFVHHIC